MTDGSGSLPCIKYRLKSLSNIEPGNCSLFGKRWRLCRFTFPPNRRGYRPIETGYSCDGIRLRTFIEAGSLGSGKTTYTETGVMWQTIIHGLFILSAMGIAFVDWLGQQNEQNRAAPQSFFARRIER